MTGWRVIRLRTKPVTPLPIDTAHIHEVVCADVRPPSCAACRMMSDGPAKDTMTATSPATTAEEDEARTRPGAGTGPVSRSTVRAREALRGARAEGCRASRANLATAAPVRWWTRPEPRGDRAKCAVFPGHPSGRHGRWSGESSRAERRVRPDDRGCLDNPPAGLGGGRQTRWRRDATVFLGGQTVSLFGSMLVQYAIMWHLTLETKSGGVLALAAVFGFLPQAVVSIFGGVWADRLNRKILIIAADASIAVTTLALALLMLAGSDDLWLIYAALTIRSIGAGIQMPAVSSLLPQLVPTSKLMRVNGINGSIQSGMMLLAPAVAGAVYAGSSIVSIFFIDLVTAVIGIGMLATIKVSRVVRHDVADGAAVGYFDDLVEGFRYLVSHTFVRWVLALYAVVFLLIVAPSYLTPLMVVRTFGDGGPDDVWKLTANELAFSVGMILGGVLLATWGGFKNRVAMIVGSTFVFGVLSVAMGLSTNMWVFFSFMFLLGLAVPAFSTTSMTVLQETVEPERQGRVFGFVGIVMALAMPLGMVIFGPLADRFSVESLLVVSGRPCSSSSRSPCWSLRGAEPCTRRASHDVGHLTR
ncbi:MFS transporter [Oerskovia sp. M15]